MGTSTRDLEQLLARAADGDMDAFGQLYHATSAKLFGIVLRILKNRAQSEDILQEIYVRVWERAGDFEPGRASIITWMATIARNRAIDALRRDKRHEVVVDDFDIDQLADHDDLSVADDVERNDALRQLEICLGGLDDERRTMVRLAYLDGFSRAELAERFAQPVGTIKTWLHRSLKQLKECLGS